MSSFRKISVGFQSAKWQLEFEPEYNKVSNGRILFSFVHPVSPDFEHVRSLTHEPRVSARRQELRSLAGGKFLLARADRMDPMKNVVRGLQAIALLLERDPSLARTFVFVNHLVSTRTTVSGYEDYAKDIRTTASQINSLWADETWSPIILEEGDDYLRAIALLLEYDALLVNPIREGMNLVAQEGPLINRRHGVLLLSTQAGAHDRLRGPAIEVSPLDVSCTASALRRAMLMKQAERNIVGPNCYMSACLRAREATGTNNSLRLSNAARPISTPGRIMGPATLPGAGPPGIPEGTVFAMKPKLGPPDDRPDPGRRDARQLGVPAMRCTATSPSPRSSRSAADGGPSKTDSPRRQGLADLDERQVRRSDSWHHWVTLAMLAAAFLHHRRRRARHRPAANGQIPLIRNEISRLFATLIIWPLRDLWHRLGLSG